MDYNLTPANGSGQLTRKMPSKSMLGSVSVNKIIKKQTESLTAKAYQIIKSSSDKDLEVMNGHMEAFLDALWQESIIADRVDEAAKSKVKSDIKNKLFHEMVAREAANGAALLLLNDKNDQGRFAVSVPETEEVKQDNEDESEPEPEGEGDGETTDEDGGQAYEPSGDGSDSDSLEILESNSNGTSALPFAIAVLTPDCRLLPSTMTHLRSAILRSVHAFSSS